MRIVRLPAKRTINSFVLIALTNDIYSNANAFKNSLLSDQMIKFRWLKKVFLSQLKIETNMRQFLLHPIWWIEIFKVSKLFRFHCVTDVRDKNFYDWDLFLNLKWMNVGVTAVNLNSMQDVCYGFRSITYILFTSSITRTGNSIDKIVFCIVFHMFILFEVSFFGSLFA